MAYKLQTLRIIPTGINLLPPGDQVAEGDCLELTGWWPGAVGKLQQTRGYVNKSAGPVGVPIDSLEESDGRVYYGGAGGLWQIGRGSSAIDTGYDGYPLGMVAFQGRVWIMNRAKQRKDDGSSTLNWTPAPPTAAPTLGSIAAITAPTHTQGGTGTGALDGPISYIVTGVLTGHPTTEGECYRSAVLITTSANSAPAIGPSEVPPGGWAGFADDDSNIITHPAFGDPDVTHWNLYRLIGPFRRMLDPSFPDTYYRVNRDPIPVASTYTDQGTDPGGPGDDQSDNALIAAGNTLAPLIPGGTKYYVTGTNALAEETSPSPALVVDGADSNEIIRPTFTDAQITLWNVYRQGGSNPPYLVNPDPIPTATTTYLDAGRDDTRYSGGIDQSDNGIANLGVILHLGPNLAPAARVAAPQSYNGRLVVANSAAHPNRVWFSEALKPASFPGSASEQDGNWVDIGTDEGDEILAMSVKPGLMLFYRSRSIWRLVGDFQDATSVIEPLMPSMGITGPRAVVSTSIGDFAMMRQGLYQAIYRLTDFEHRLSAKVEPVLGFGGGAENYSALNPAGRALVALGYQLGRLWVSYTDGSNTINSRSLIYEVATDRWYGQTHGFGCFCNGSQFFLAGLNSGNVVSLEDGALLAGVAWAPIDLAYQSAYLDCGRPDREKTWGDLVISHNLNAATLTVTVLIDKKADGGTADSFTLATITSSLLTRQVIPLVYPAGYVTTALRGKPIRSLNLSIRISGTAATAEPGCVIDTPILLHYYLEARKGRTFDSGITDHALEGVGTVDEVELDIDTTDGAATLVISSDLPGGVMADRTSGGLAIAQTSGRQVLRLVLTTPIDGRRFRHQISTTTGFALYGYRVRMLPIGVYVNGVQSEKWITGSLVPGV